MKLRHTVLPVCRNAWASFLPVCRNAWAAFLPAFAALALAAAAACSSGPSAPQDSISYTKRVADWQATRDKVVLEEPDLIPKEKRDTLVPLRYYEPDSAYSVPAVLRVADDRPVFEMPTSTGTLRRMQLVGTLEFTLQGQPMSLAAFMPEGAPRIESLFVPFADVTTGKETYSAGRYLDLHPTATGLYTIDFNYAYNPSCAYNESYECPFPPPSNRLKVEIRAGEKAPGA